MTPLALKKLQPAMVQRALQAHGFEVRVTSESSAKILQRGVQIGLWSGSQLELQLSAEELSRVRKSLALSGLLEGAG